MEYSADIENAFQDFIIMRGCAYVLILSVEKAGYISYVTSTTTLQHIEVP